MDKNTRRERLTLLTSRIDGYTRTPQGGLRLDAYLTRVGIFDYSRADGTVTRELRPTAHVFSEASLASLRGAPVTDLHPIAAVDTSNWRELTVGHVADDVRADGDFVRASVVINDADTIARIEAGERVEISCGYQTELVPESGTYHDQRYDAVQTAITYNHVALGPRGWGRAGSDVALRLDAADNVIPLEQGLEPMSETPKAEVVERKADGTLAVEAEAPVVAEQPTYTLDSEWVQSVDVRIAELTAQVTGLQAVLAAQDNAPAPEAEPAAAEEVTKTDSVDALVEAKLALRETARKLCGESVRFDGLSDREICLRALETTGTSASFESASDETLQTLVRFAASVKPNSPSVREQIGAPLTVDNKNDRLPDLSSSLDKIFNRK